MTATMSIEQATKQREKDIEANRSLGVQEWSNNEPQSDRVFEVVEGYHHVPAHPGAEEKLALGPGHRFRPTKQQVETGSLAGKARELTETEYRGIRRHERPPLVQGADFREMELRSIPMADGVRQSAYDGGLSAEDFEGIEPASKGQFTRAQVEDLIGKKGAGA